VGGDRRKIKEKSKLTAEDPDAVAPIAALPGLPVPCFPAHAQTILGTDTLEQ